MAIEVEPARLSLTGRAGEVLTAQLQVTNCGADEQLFAADRALKLRAAGALAGSVKRAFKPPNQDFADRLIELGAQMAKAPSVSVAVNGRMDARVLAEGKTSTVLLELALPDELEPNTTWTGSLAVLGKRVRVRLDAVATD